MHLIRSYLGGGQASRYEDVAGWPLTAARPAYWPRSARYIRSST